MTNPADNASLITIAVGFTTGAATIVIVNNGTYKPNETVIVTMRTTTVAGKVLGDFFVNDDRDNSISNTFDWKNLN